MPDWLTGSLGVVRAVVPVFSLVALGWVLRRIRLLGPEGVGDLTRLVFWVGLPAHLITVIARSDLRQAVDLGAVLAAVIGFLVALIAGLVAGRHLAPAARGSLASGVSRANAAYLGLPIVTLVAQGLESGRGEVLAVSFHVILAVMVPVFNVGSVFGFLLPNHGLSRRGLRASLRELPRNPLILASVLGIILSLTMPGRLEGTLPGTVLCLVADSAVPLALIVTGAALEPSLLRTARWPLVVACLGKLVLVPALVWVLARALGAGAEALAAAVVLMACPTAVANVPMARQLGGDEPLMAAMVVATTAIAPATLLVWLVLLT